MGGLGRAQPGGATIMGTMGSSSSATPDFVFQGLRTFLGL